MLGIYQLELTSACNLSCHFCPRQQPWYTRKDGFLTPELVEDMAARGDFDATAYLEVQFTGEPLLHPQAEAIIGQLKRMGLSVGLSTNATDRVLPALVFLLVKGLLDAVTINDDMYRRPTLARHPAVHVQQLGWNFPVEDYTRLVTQPVPSCTTPLRCLSVHWNGDVVPCCHDHNGLHVLGNLHRASLQEIEEGGPYHRFIEGLAGQSPNGLCEYCDYPNPHRIHEAIVK